MYIILSLEAREAVVMFQSCHACMCEQDRKYVPRCNTLAIALLTWNLGVARRD